MGLFSSKKNTNSNVNWIPLNSIEQLNELTEFSKEKPVVIFKHSTRCSISTMSKSRLDSNWVGTDEDAVMVYLDLIKYRDLSTQIASDFNIMHESPQILVIKNGVCTYSATHGNIDAKLVKAAL
ncbi:bacillithiol system redox-active protein YtxJ [Putridiphycobacter roseus]|uniref:Bacillithiol system redox-active protein YtxJ n=1 Tax=Putridiphycobacter roseus TaxID=2219161 RepID=A0A2W1MYN5_9FLAO|nr:bacillithiol system redox-active protein YtxJ [Putridiphycobacter roseus]PZE17299.1 bacillithiol system redox-active protein YtxJ [Putridiphycobacter roseus]